MLIAGVFIALAVSMFSGLGAAQYYDDYSYTYCSVCNILMFVIVLVTCIWVYIDGTNIAGPDGKVLHTSPILWALCVFLLWIICFPWYLYARHKHLQETEQLRRMAAKRQPVQTIPACKNCGAPLEWLPEKKAWICRKCAK